MLAACWIIFIILTIIAFCVWELQFSFFLEVGYFCSAVCSVNKMMWFLFADWDYSFQDRVTVFEPAFSGSITWFVRATVFSTSWNILVLIDYFLCPPSSAFSVSTVGTILDGWKVFYEFHLDSNHWHRHVMYRIAQASGYTCGKRSFEHALWRKPHLFKFLVFRKEKYNIRLTSLRNRFWVKGGGRKL
jgi:hypothetical protein